MKDIRPGASQPAAGRVFRIFVVAHADQLFRVSPYRTLDTILAPPHLFNAPVHTRREWTCPHFWHKKSPETQLVTSGDGTSCRFSEAACLASHFSCCCRYLDS